MNYIIFNPYTKSSRYFVFSDIVFILVYVFEMTPQ